MESFQAHTNSIMSKVLFNESVHGRLQNIFIAVSLDMPCNYLLSHMATLCDETVNQFIRSK